MNTLLDNTNFDQFLPELVELFKVNPIVGLDCETDQPHIRPELAAYAKSQKTFLYEPQSLMLCGASFYFPVGDKRYYVDLGHKGNRQVSKAKLLDLLRSKPEDCTFVIHNVPFEYFVFNVCLGYELKKTICTLQMAVSTFDADQYDINDFPVKYKQWLEKTVQPWLFANKEEEFDRLVDLMSQKESRASHSYNGFVQSMSYKYGLKPLVKKLLGVTMTTFEDTVNGKGMSELEASEVLDYACDDAVYAVKLYEYLLNHMLKVNPLLVQTFFEQENPMTTVYGKIKLHGMRVSLKEVQKYKQQEIVNYANEAKNLRKQLQPYKDNLYVNFNPDFEDTPWLASSGSVIIGRLSRWLSLPDDLTVEEELSHLSGAVAKAVNSTGDLNLTYYQTLRIIFYKMLQLKNEGFGSDGEARGKLREACGDDKQKQAVIDTINRLSGIEQRMKLYLTPYEVLVNPETDRVYPTVSSRLVTRRISANHPNAMQLAKRGTSTYVRGFYLPDRDDHLLVSLDLSGIELVEIGEFSRDPSFIDAYSTIPHKDLHSVAAASVLGVRETDFKRLSSMTEKEAVETMGPNILINIRGEKMDPARAYKYWRTEVGKGANFNYWYSGALSTVGERLGWTSEKMWQATEQYRNRFPIAEQWRMNIINTVEAQGYIELPDHHRRVRIEATYGWHNLTRALAGKILNGRNYSIVDEVLKRVKRRARNQAVNALIQGTCATLIKRSILKILSDMDTSRASLLMSIHDEILFSVHISYLEEFLNKARFHMTNHPDIFKHCKLYSSASIGRTFEPYHEIHAPFGQIELDEPPPKLNSFGKIVDYLVKGA